MKEKSDRKKELRGIVFNIQRYSIHDGPGIRTTVFLKGCPLKCFWCHNPESQKIKPEISLNKRICNLCGACVHVCPHGANSLSEASSTVDRGKCLACGKCASVCPTQARTLVGKYMTVAEVMDEIMRDKLFYDNSGGGVTLSGGDPTMQSKFSLQLLRKCKENGLHTAIETCGYSSWATIEGLLAYLDYVLYDIKCLEPVKHRNATGKHNRMIIENARKIAGRTAMKIRVPLVPQFNDSSKDVEAIGRFTRQELGLSASHLELLRYNKLGEGKYERLDRECDRRSFEPQSEEKVRELETIISRECRS